MAQIIDFERAKNRLRPEIPPRTYMIVELPEDFARQMNRKNPPVVMAQIDLLIL